MSHATKFDAVAKARHFLAEVDAAHARGLPPGDALRWAAASEHLTALLGALASARKLLLPLEWLDDHGRECAWCAATRHTFNQAEVIGTPRERKARDNHHEDCRWLAFVKATEGL